MKNENEENHKPKKYPISKEFGFYKKYKLPFNELVFVNADRIMGVLPKAIRGTKKVDVKTKRIKSYDGEMIKILTFEPKEVKTDKILLYVHGGCFVYRGALNHFNFCEKLASNGLCKVVYVDYRLAYKHKYPTSIEDTFAAYKDIINNKKDNNKILVCGDSAGGCIAVDVVRKAKEQNIYIPDCLMLLYPVLDKRMKTESMKEFTDTPIWNSVLNKKMWDLYLKDNPNYISPGEMKDVSFMPKTYIETAEFDCLHDEAIEFAEKLKQANVDVIVNETKKTMHGYDLKNGKITREMVKKRMELISKV